MGCIMLLLVSCKNKQAAKTIEGTWAEVKIDGQEVPAGSQDLITFDQCKAKKDDFCDLAIYDAGSDSTYTLFYNIQDKGKTLVLRQGGGWLTINSYNDIVELTDNSMTIEWDDSYTGEYVKQ